VEQDFIARQVQPAIAAEAQRIEVDLLEDHSPRRNPPLAFMEHHVNANPL
jgi:hypothetical protein